MKNTVTITVVLILLSLFTATAFAQGNSITKEQVSATLSSPAEKGKNAEPPLTDIYRVGTGDVLDIRLLNSPNNRSTLFTVLENGLIEFQLTGGTLTVSGLTTDQIQTLIATELKRRAIQDNARVSVSVRQYTSHSVIVTGAVSNPGTKVLRREAVPLYVLLAEVQPRVEAKQATIIRGNDASPITVGLESPQLLDTLVRSGDVINISGRPDEFFYIGGRITFPGQKAFQPGITLLQAILAAGGTTRQADIVELSREGNDSRLSTTTFSIRDIKSGKVKDPKLLVGDRIEIIR